MASLFEADFSGANAAAVKASIEAQGGSYSLPDANILIGGAPDGSNAIKISDSGTDYLRYPISGKINFPKGTIDCWLRCEDQISSEDNLSILKAFWQENLTLAVQAATSMVRVYLPYPGGGIYNAAISEYDPPAWAAQSWHRLIILWDFSNAAPADNYIVIRTDDHYHDPTVGGISQLNPGSVDPSQFIYLLSQGGTNPFNGYIASLKIYNDLNILYTKPPHASSWFNPHDSGVTETEFRNHFPDGDYICGRYETHYDTRGITGSGRPTDCPLVGAGIAPGKDLFFFNKPSIETVYPGHVPTAAEVADSDNPAGAYTWQGCPGQIVPMFFNVHPRINLTGVTVHFDTVNGFTGSGSNIAPSNLEIFLVDNWFTASPSFGFGAMAYPDFMPELFLKNDKINGDNPPVAGRLDSNSALSQFVAPHLPPQDHVSTELPRAESRQLCLITKIPAGQASGNYTTTITISSNELADQTQVLNLEVLPFTLDTGGMKQFAMYDPTIHAWICEGNGCPAIAELWPMVVNHMKMMKEMGVNFLIISNTIHGSGGIYTWPDPTLSALWDDYSYVVAPYEDHKGNTTFEDLMHNICACAKEAGIEDICIWVPQPDVGGLAQWEADVKQAIEICKLYGFTGAIWGRDEFAAGWCNTYNATSKMRWTGGDTNWWSQPSSRYTGKVWIETIGGGGALYDVISQDGYEFVISPAPPDQTGAWWLTGDQYLISEWTHEGGGYCVASRCESHTALDDYLQRFPGPNNPHGQEYHIGIIGDPYFGDLLDGSDTPSLPGAEAMYYQARSYLYPVTLRYWAGYFVYLTGLAGICPTFLVPISPGYDFPGRNGGFIFSARQGPIPTMQVQAHRSGVDDARFVFTWKNEYERVLSVNPGLAATSKTVIDGILLKYKTNSGTIQDYADDRYAIIQQIKILLDAHATGTISGMNPGKVAAIPNVAKVMTIPI